MFILLFYSNTITMKCYKAIQKSIKILFHVNILPKDALQRRYAYVLNSPLQALCTHLKTV